MRNPLRSIRSARTRLVLTLALATALLGACDAAGPSSVATNIATTPTPAAASVAASKAPTAPASAAPSIRPPVTSAPSAGATAAPTRAPTPAPTAAPPEPTAAPAQSADGCSGNASNKTFFASTSTKVTWALYCAVLPSGWFVNAGSYTQASGGTMTVTYKNNSGASLELKEGFWCQGVPIECGPYDTLIGTLNYGDMSGQFAKKGSSYVLYVKAGQNPAWAATGTGIDEATFRSFAAALRKVAK